MTNDWSKTYDRTKTDNGRSQALDSVQLRPEDWKKVFERRKKCNFYWIVKNTKIFWKWIYAYADIYEAIVSNVFEYLSWDRKDDFESNPDKILLSKELSVQEILTFFLLLRIDLKLDER